MRKNEILAIFLSGATVMVIELTGSRLVAPYIGSSVFVWTSLIGVILSFLSIGYYLGGHFSDRNPSRSTLSSIALYAGLATASIALMNVPVLNIISQIDLDLRIKAVIATSILFAVPSILLGMILPYCVRINISNIENSGRLVGRLYAVSTAGSIVGTFLGGFFLVSFFGTISIYILCGATMVFASLLFCSQTQRGLKLSALIFLIIWGLLFSLKRPASALQSTFDIDTNYHRVLIKDVVKEQVPMRMMITDPHGAQSVMNRNDPSALSSSYTKALGAVISEVSEKNEILVLGGGAYTLPKYIQKSFPKSLLTVVEIDEQLTEIAKEHFAFAPTERVRIEHTDARLFLKKTPLRLFDLVIFDIFSSSPSIPFHLVTHETFESIGKIMKKNSILAMNVISSTEGDGANFLKRLSSTLALTFPHVRVFKVEPKTDPQEPQNVIVVASRSDSTLSKSTKALTKASQELQIDYQKTKWSAYYDDFAPVEWDLLPILGK